MRLGYMHYKSSCLYAREKYFVSKYLNIGRPISRIIERLNQFLVSMLISAFIFWFSSKWHLLPCSLTVISGMISSYTIKWERITFIILFLPFMLEKNDENLYHCLCVSFNRWDSVLCNLLWEIFPLSYTLHDFCRFQFNVKFCKLTLQSTVKLFNFLFFSLLLGIMKFHDIFI